MEKLNLTKKYKDYYSSKTHPTEITLDTVSYLSITGKGDPSGKEFAEKIQALYATAYTIKFEQKELGKDFVVPKLEGLWWFDESVYGNIPMELSPLKIPRSEWEYRLLIRMPEYISDTHIHRAVERAMKKKDHPYIPCVEPYELTEGKCVQILHIGSFDTEVRSLQKMVLYISEKDLKKNGFHHEIYLSDFRRVAPDRLKTILREPVCD